MAVFLAMSVLGLAIFLAGVVLDDRTLRGVGLLFAFVGFVGALWLLIRWLVFRGIG